jgi:hypothetical protein
MKTPNTLSSNTEKHFIDKSIKDGNPKKSQQLKPILKCMYLLKMTSEENRNKGKNKSK